MERIERHRNRHPAAGSHARARSGLPEECSPFSFSMIAVICRNERCPLKSDAEFAFLVGIIVERPPASGPKRMSAVKPARLLIPLVLACLFLLLREPRGAVQGQEADPAPPPAKAQPNASLALMYILFHPRFYKENGPLGLRSALYVQNRNQGPMLRCFGSG